MDRQREEIKKVEQLAGKETDSETNREDQLVGNEEEQER